MSFRTFDFTSYSSEELVQVGQAIESLVRAPGWRVFMDFIRNREKEVGLRALDDDTKDRSYWQGYRDGCRIEEGINSLLALLAEEKENRNDEDGIERFMRGRAGGGGDLAGM